MKARFISLLQSTNRVGIEILIAMLEKTDFFTAPASMKFHGCYPGGLVAHCLGVYDQLLMQTTGRKLDEVQAAGQKPLPITRETLIIAALLHDVCKIGAYVPNDKGGYSWNKQQPKGHARLSIERIKEHIGLTELEEMMILYHMGLYGLNEFYKADDWQTGEYPLRGDDQPKEARYGKSLANAWYHNPICKVLYFCDELATMAEKAESNQEAAA